MEEDYETRIFELQEQNQEQEPLQEEEFKQEEEQTLETYEEEESDYTYNQQPEKNFKPNITNKAYEKLEAYTRLAEKEIGGLLRIQTIKNIPTITDVTLIKQTATHGDFELDPESTMDFMTSLPFEQQKEWCGWWHKHPITGWSITDDETFERLYLNNSGYCLGIVKQSNGKFLIRLDVGRVDNGKPDNKTTFQTEQFEITYKQTKKDSYYLKEIKEKVTHQTVFEEFEENKSITKTLFNWMGFN